MVVAVSLEFADDLHTPEIERAVRDLEGRIRQKHPEVVALFVKPQSRRGFREAARAHGDGIAFADPNGTERATREGAEGADRK